MKEVQFHLDSFDGPLDLLLYLISKNKVEITDIPIAAICEQYLDYIRQMQEFDLDIAADFIAMAAQLMYIKSRMLLPSYDEENAEDPRAELVQALLEYQRFKEAGTVLSEREELGRDLYVRAQEQLERDPDRFRYDYTVDVLVRAVEDIFQRAERAMPPPVSAFEGIVGREPVPVEDKISALVQLFSHAETIDFQKLVLSAASRSEVVAIFLAVLELSKSHKVLIEDTEDGYQLRLAPREEPPVTQTEERDGAQ